MGKAKIWQKMSVKQIREALKETPTVLIPIGCTEQHGYHMSTDVDNHNAWEVCVRAADETGAFVAPLLPYSFSGGELPGTLNINLNVVSLMTTELLRSVAFHGLKNLIVVLGHGGTDNTAAIRRGAYHFVRDYPGYRDCSVAVHCFWELCPLFLDSFQKERDYHAARFETSLMMYWKPEEVFADEMQLDRDDIAEMMRDNPDAYQVFDKAVDHESIVAHVSQHPEIEVGVMGDPFKADAEFGERLCAEAVASLVDLIGKMEG
jgi:creatinine amidohydrolase